jgi:hypothetical protein
MVTVGRRVIVSEACLKWKTPTIMKKVRELEELTWPSSFSSGRDGAVCFVGLQIGNPLAGR